MEDLTVEELALKIKEIIKKYKKDIYLHERKRDDIEANNEWNLDTLKKVHHEDYKVQESYGNTLFYINKMLDSVLNGCDIEKNENYMRLSTEKMKSFASHICIYLDIKPTCDFEEFYSTRDFINSHIDKYKEKKKLLKGTYNIHNDYNDEDESSPYYFGWLDYPPY